MYLRKHGNCYHLHSSKKASYEENTDWLVFYWGKRFDLSYETCGYFDNRPRIVIALFFFSLTICLPFRNKWTDECDPPKYGIAYHNQIFWIYRGGEGNMNGGNKWWTYHVPWSLDWVRTSLLLKDGTWEHSLAGKGRGKSFWEDQYVAKQWQEKHPYTYILRSGTVQERLATIHVEEREWRQRWLKWLPFFNKVARTIAVDFNEEVGEGTGSWKGGTVGCGYDLKKDETPLQCLRRMESERKFR